MKTTNISKLMVMMLVILSVFGMASSLAVVKNSNLEISTPVNYNVSFRGKKVEMSYDKNKIVWHENRFYYKLSKLSGKDIKFNETMTILYKDAATDADNTKYDVKLTIDNLHLYNVSIGSSAKPKYWGFLSQINSSNVSNSLHFVFRFYDSKFNEVGTMDYTSGCNIDCRMQVLDKSGNVKSGTFIFHAIDLDVGNKNWEFGKTKRSESIVFKSGFNESTLTLHNKTLLKYEAWGDHKRVRGSKEDEGTIKSSFTIIANSNCKFGWQAGRSCGTHIKFDYQPVVVSINKVNESGQGLAGATMSLKRSNGATEEWVTDGTTKTFLLNFGTHTVSEKSAPTGYDLAPTVTIKVANDGGISTTGASSANGANIVMTDKIKNAKLVVHHYELGDNDVKTTTKIKDNTGATIEDEETIKKMFEPYTSAPRTDIAEYYEYKTVVGTPEGTLEEPEVIVSYYYALKNYPFTINYLEKGTNSPIAPSENGEAKYGSSVLAEDYKIQIAGFNFDSVDKDQITISVDEQANVINIYYERVDVEYIVNYLDKETGDKIATSKTDTAKYEDVIEAQDEIIDIEGFTYREADKDEITLGLDKNDNVINLYYDRNSYGYTINYLDKVSGEKIIDSKEDTALFDSIINATDEVVNIPEYAYDSADKDSITISVDEANNVINLYYVKNKYNYIVEFLDKDTDEPISPREIDVGESGDVINSVDKEKPIEGYEIDSSEPDQITVVGYSGDTIPDENIIKVYYKRNNYNYEIIHVDKDTGLEIGTREEDEAPYKTVLKADDKKQDIEGYVYDSSDKDQITIDIDENNNKMTLYYKKGTYNYTINYLDKDTNEPLHNGRRGKATFQDVITADNFKLEIPGYSYDSVDHDEITISANPNENIINIYYTKNPYKFVVNYLNKDNNEKLIDSKSGDALYKEVILAEDYKEVIGGYTLASIDNEELTIGTNEELNVINIYYGKGTFKYTVKYLDIDTNEPILEEKTQDAIFEEVVKAEDKVEEIDGYDFDHPSAEELTVLADTTNELILYYKKKPFPLVINYLELDTEKPIKEPKEVEYPFNEEVPTSGEIIKINGYDYDSISADSITITSDPENNVINIFYKKIPSPGSPSPRGKVIVKYINKATNQEIAEEDIMNGNVGSKYVSKGQDIEGWNPAGASENTEGKYEKDDIIVYYYYVQEKDFDLDKGKDGKHEWYLRGYEDYTFRMNNNVTREEVATIFYRLTVVAEDDLRQDYDVKIKPFKDVELDRWSIRPIAYMKELGIMKGYDDGTFKPLKPITRAEFAQVILNYIKEPSKDANMFSDLDDNHWATEAVLSAVNEGWIKGYDDGTFKPEKNISRVETVAIVNRMLERSLRADEVSKIKVPVVDLDSNHWGYADVLEAITSHDYETSTGESGEKWNNYRYPFHEDMSEDAYNDV